MQPSRGFLNFFSFIFFSSWVFGVKTHLEKIHPSIHPSRWGPIWRIHPSNHPSIHPGGDPFEEFIHPTIHPSIQVATVSTTTTCWWLFLLPFLSLSQAERRRESAEGKEGRKEGRRKKKRKKKRRTRKSPEFMGTQLTFISSCCMCHSVHNNSHFSLSKWCSSGIIVIINSFLEWPMGERNLLQLHVQDGHPKNLYTQQQFVCSKKGEVQQEEEEEEEEEEQDKEEEKDLLLWTGRERCLEF